MSLKKRRASKQKELEKLVEALENQLDEPGGDLPPQLNALVQRRAERKGWTEYDGTDERFELLVDVLKDAYPKAADIAKSRIKPSLRDRAVLGLCLIWVRYGMRVLKEDVITWAGAARYLGDGPEGVSLNQLKSDFSWAHLDDLVEEIKAGAKSLFSGQKASGYLKRCKDEGFKCLAQAIIEEVEASELAPYYLARVPVLPSTYVNRPHLMTKLIQRVESAPGGHEPVVVLGGGGTGKTTLLAAYGKQVEADEARHLDGVFFFTLGEQPLLVKYLRHLAARVGHPLPLDVNETQEIEPYLRAILGDKQVFIFVDHLVHSEDLRPFLVGGPGCRLVVSSRYDAVADELAVSRERRVMVDDMEWDEAEELCRKLLETEAWQWGEDDRRGLEEVGKLVGRSPLVLETLVTWVPEMGWKNLLASLREKLWEPSSCDMTGWELRICNSLKVSLDALGEQRDWLLGLAVLPQVSSFGVDAAALLYGVREGEAAERLSLLVKHHLLKIVDEPGFGGRRYRVHGLVLRCLRCEAGVDVDGERTFAWAKKYQGVLFDRRGYWLPVLASPPWWETKPWEGYWWLAPKSIEPHFLGRIRWPYKQYVDRVWKRGGMYVPFEVWATAYQLGRRRRPLLLSFVLSESILLVVGCVLGPWVDTWVSDFAGRLGMPLLQRIPFGLVITLPMLLLASWPYLAYSISWLKFIHRYVHGYMAESAQSG